MGDTQIEEKNITKLNVMMICILQNHVCETIAVAAKSCYKYSGLPAYPLKVDFIVTLFFSILSSIESHFCIKQASTTRFTSIAARLDADYISLEFPGRILQFPEILARTL